MRYASSAPRSHAPRGPRHATVLIDADDLLYRRDTPVLTDLVRSLSGFLHRTVGARLQSGRAYADFSNLDAPLQRDLYAAGIDPVFAGRTASDLMLAMDAAVLLASSDPGVLVIVTGSRSYAPVARRARALGRRVLVIAAEPARDADYDTYSLADLSGEGGRERTGGSGEERAPRPPREGITYVPIENSTALRALEVIEEWFGQYDEVYLTPLLRKLTEEMADVDADPKGLISDLEGHGAVYLERRPGRPHDYTVLLVDGQHPDVVRVRALFEDDTDDDAPVASSDAFGTADDDAF